MPTALKSLVTIALVVAVQTLGAPAQSVSNCSLGIMSFNLRTSLANDPCPSGCWRHRKERIRKMLSENNPDLIGTQEGAPDQIAFFQEELGYESIGDCAGDCAHNECNSIFFKPERWKLLKSKTFALSDTPDVIPSNTWSLEYLRAAVLGRFTDIESAQVVCMLNTHYDITRGQNQSSELVARLLGDFCANGDGVIMTGDLNALPESPAVRYLVGEGSIDGSISSLPLFDTLTAAGEGGGTWIGGSFNGNITGGKIDYILTPVNGQVCLQSAKIINDTYGGFACSDHAAVQSSLCIGSGCSACLS